MPLENIIKISSKIEKFLLEHKDVMGKVIIADDNSDMREIYAGTIKYYHPEEDIICVENGFAFLEAGISILTSGRTIDMAVLDHFMPVMDGMQAVAEFRRYESRLKTKSPIPIYMVSGTDHGNPIGMREQALKAGANDYFLRGGRDDITEILMAKIALHLRA